MLENAFYKTSDNQLLLGGTNELAVISMKDILESPLQNKLVLTQMLVNGKRTETGSRDRIVLEKHQNSVALYFSTLSYLENNKVFYKYKINDEPWNSLGSNSELMFGYLQPGMYHIVIRAKDFLENHQEQQLVLTLELKPPFTKSVPFYILLTVFAALITFGVFKYSVYRKLKEKGYQLKIKDAEMKMLRAQMNPHFMFNTLNSINSYIIRNKTEDASKYLTAFSRLMRNILESSKLQFISVQQEIKTTSLYVQLEVVRLDHSFDYQIETDPNLSDSEVLVPPLIVQPFAENAIWHGLRHKKEKGLLDNPFSFKTGKLSAH